MGFPKRAPDTQKEEEDGNARAKTRKKEPVSLLNASKEQVANAIAKKKKKKKRKKQKKMRKRKNTKKNEKNSSHTSPSRNRL
mgnify:CR=1 FL=1